MFHWKSNNFIYELCIKKKEKHIYEDTQKYIITKGNNWKAFL